MGVMPSEYPKLYVLGLELRNEYTVPVQVKGTLWIHTGCNQGIMVVASSIYGLRYCIPAI